MNWFTQTKMLQLQQICHIGSAADKQYHPSVFRVCAPARWYDIQPAAASHAKHRSSTESNTHVESEICESATNMEDAAAQTTVLKTVLTIPKHSKDAPNQLQRVLNFLGYDRVQKSDKPVRIGVLGASQVYLCAWVVGEGRSAANRAISTSTGCCCCCL